MSMRRNKGFTLAELAIVLVVIGLLIGGVLKGAQMVRQSKMKRQSNDLSGLSSAVELFYDRIGRLAGDLDGDGAFDSNDDVWTDLESEDLGDQDNTSPYGEAYTFGYGAVGGLTGNYVIVAIPPKTALFCDRTLDDGDPTTGFVRSDSDYSGDDKIDVAHFIFSD